MTSNYKKFIDEDEITMNKDTAIKPNRYDVHTLYSHSLQKCEISRGYPLNAQAFHWWC